MSKTFTRAAAVATASFAIAAIAAGAATAAPPRVYNSHAEARYLQAEGPLGALVDPIGEQLESGGVEACEQANPDCKNVGFVQGPLDPLKQLTVPLGDQLALTLGAINDYAAAGSPQPGESFASTGAVDRNGIISTGEQGIPPGGATLDLTGSALSPIADAVADIKLVLGAVSASASLGRTNESVERDYDVAGGAVVLTVPLLAQVGTQLSTATGAVLADPLVLNATNICNLLTNLVSLPGAAATPVPLPADCSAASALDGVISGKITGLSALTDGLANVTKGGLTFDFAAGTITIDLDAALFAVTGKHLNEQPPNTDVLQTVLPALVLNLDDLVESVKTNVVDELIENGKLELTLLAIPPTPGIALPPLELKQLGDAGLTSALDQLFDGLTTGLDAVADPLAPALGTITDGLANVLQIIVNVPDLYTSESIVGDASTGLSITEVTRRYSQTALRLTVGPDAAIADLRLGTVQVGPNSNNPGDKPDEPVGDPGKPKQKLPNTGAGQYAPYAIVGTLLTVLGSAALWGQRRKTML